MTSVDSNFNFLCGRPHGAGPPSTCVHLSLTPSPLRVDVINGWPLIISSFIWTGWQNASHYYTNRYLIKVWYCLGVCGSLVVTYAAVRLLGPGSNPDQGRHLDWDFCFMHTPKPHHRNQKWYPCRFQARTWRECWWWAVCSVDNTTVKRMRRLKSIATHSTPMGLGPQDRYHR